MKRLLLISVLFLIFFCFSSHELFLKATSYFLEPYENTELFLFNGTFDKSENEITTERISDSNIIGPDFELKINQGGYYYKDAVTYLKFITGEEGTYAAGISTLPRVLEMSSEDFNAYLEHEGLTDMILERKEDGSANSGASEKYSKHVKAIFQVGKETTDSFNTVFGFPIEFVPLDNPYEAKVGDSISFKLLSGGKPLPNHVVHYSTSVPGQDAHDNENSTRTDENGTLSIVPSKAGNWYVATIHIVKSEEEGLDYESNWATLTFGIQ